MKAGGDWWNVTQERGMKSERRVCRVGVFSKGVCNDFSACETPRRAIYLKILAEFSRGGSISPNLSPQSRAIMLMS